MHPSSMREMAAFATTLNRTASLRIADIGSGDVNGTYRALFAAPTWKYHGVDVEAGSNVDIVLDHPYKWAIPSASYDVVVSGQALEHVRQPWLWIKEIARITTLGGKVCVIAPHTWHYHEFPVDCWRVWPEGMSGLFAHAQIT